MKKITKKVCFESLANATKIEKLFLPLRLENDMERIIQEVEQQAINKLKANNNTTIIKKSNSLCLNGSYLYFTDIKECFKYNNEVNAIIVKTDLNIIVYFIN